MAYIGPTLPPHLQKKQEEEENEDDDVDPDCGPALPPHLRRDDVRADTGKREESDDTDEESYGPALPQHLLHRSTDTSHSVEPGEVLGPKKPTRETVNNIGPSLPPGFIKSKGDSEAEEDEEIVGPLPPSYEASYSQADEYERRAAKMKAHLRGEDREVDTGMKRETWMLELPEVHAKAFGLGPRQFQKNAKPELKGREEWTATPGSEKKTEPSEEELHEEMVRRAQEEKRNAELEKIVEENNKSKRTDSLMKIHDKSRKRKKEEESSKPKERRAFDRDIDLKANQLDEAKRKALIKKSQQLGSRFFTGSQKFL